MKRNHRLVLVVAAAFATGTAAAANIDLSAEMVKRLDRAGKLKPLYKAKTGRDMPATMNATLYFQGEVKGRGLKLSLPAAIPSQPKVIDQNDVDNCYSETIPGVFELSGETVKSTNFQNTDQVETGQKFEISVTYDSPFGMSGVSATASASTERRQVSIKSEGATESELIKWLKSSTIPVPPEKGLTVQLVVTEQKLANVPYTANFILDGPAKVVFSAGAAGYTWAPRRGSTPPTSPYPPLKTGAQSNGAPLFICRAKNGENYTYGKTHGDGVCYFGAESNLPMGMPGGRTDTYEFLLGAPDSLALGDPNTQGAFDPDGKGGQICVLQYNGPLPGWVTKSGVCLAHWDNRTVASRSYQVLLDPRQGGVETQVNLSALLPNEADRTIDLRGNFSGVSALNSRIVYGRARAAVCGDEPVTVKAKAGGASAGALGAKSTKQLKVRKAAPGAPLPGA